MKAFPFRETLNRPQELLLMTAMLFAALPHIEHLSPWIMSGFGFLIIWRYLMDLYPSLQPGRFLLFTVTIMGALLVYQQYQRFYGREGGTALLLMGMGLKLLEMKTRREVYLLIDLIFFLALTQFLFTQSIFMGVFTLVSVTLGVATLISTNAGSAFSLRESISQSARLVLQALPVMLVLFFLFPRIPGPLWQLPEDGQTHQTGIGDVLEPGSVSHLGLSKELAFRVNFEGAPPPAHERYWRGAVFWNTDGKKWTAAKGQAQSGQVPLETSGNNYRYSLILEPHWQKWLFSLEMPTRLPSEAEISQEFMVLIKDKLTDRRRFDMVSNSRYRITQLSTQEKEMGLQLPAEKSARITNLVQSWQSLDNSPTAMVRSALNLFHEENFVYTLNPQALNEHPVEEFLFETRRGFCEHYATAFVILMRTAGIPARVITGYQGGQLNPIGNFLEVRQSEAHAWAEVWLDDKGWIRVDPTAAVAPSRIEEGIDPDLIDADGSVLFDVNAESSGGRNSLLRQFLRQSRILTGSLDHAWNRFVLSYDRSKQNRLLEQLGIKDWKIWAVYIYGLLGLSVALVLVLFRVKPKTRLDESVRLYNQFLARLGKQGIIRKKNEGPLDFAERSAKLLPEQEKAIKAITAIYIRQRYGRLASPENLLYLRQLVNRFIRN